MGQYYCGNFKKTLVLKKQKLNWTLKAYFTTINFCKNLRKNYWKSESPKWKNWIYFLMNSSALEKENLTQRLPKRSKAICQHWRDSEWSKNINLGHPKRNCSRTSTFHAIGWQRHENDNEGENNQFCRRLNFFYQSPSWTQLKNESVEDSGTLANGSNSTNWHQTARRPATYLLHSTPTAYRIQGH